MLQARRLLLLACTAALAASCQNTSNRVATLESQNRALSEQSRAQLAEIENLKIHTRNVEDQLIHAEQDLARADDHAPRAHLAGLGMPAGVSGRLAALADRYPSLQFDPQTGISKLDGDVLFDSGDDRLKPGADQILKEIAEIFGAPEARDLKLMVVGHADDRRIKGRELRERYPNNWHLERRPRADRGRLAAQSGIPEERMGVAGFGQYQPISPNDTADARSRNRRVEIYVLGPETPVVGWADTSGSFYR